jgi:hypothetical protein
MTIVFTAYVSHSHQIVLLCHQEKLAAETFKVTEQTVIMFLILGINFALRSALRTITQTLFTLVTIPGWQSNLYVKQTSYLLPVPSQAHVN